MALGSTLVPMKMESGEVVRRLTTSNRGVLCTLSPERGVHPEPCLYAAHGDLLGFAVEAIKDRDRPRLDCEKNLEADPRAALLVEHWDPADWSKLWWVRAELRHVATPDAEQTEGVSSALAAAFERFRDRPFDRLVVFEVVGLTGWAATG